MRFLLVLDCFILSFLTLLEIKIWSQLWSLFFLVIKNRIPYNSCRSSSIWFNLFELRKSTRSQDRFIDIVGTWSRKNVPFGINLISVSICLTPRSRLFLPLHFFVLSNGIEIFDFIWGDHRLKFCRNFG